jgi:hypothetical protein
MNVLITSCMEIDRAAAAGGMVVLLEYIYRERERCLSAGVALRRAG